MRVNSTTKEVEFHSLSDCAESLQFAFGQDEFPTDRDIAAWMEINAAAFHILYAKKNIQPWELSRLWKDAQALLLGLLIHKAYVPSFLQGVDILLQAALKLGGDNRFGISGDIYLVPRSADVMELSERLLRLKSEISDSRRSQLLYLISGQGGHPRRRLGLHGNPGLSKIAPESESNVRLEFQHSIAVAIGIRRSFSGDTLELERAAMILERTFRDFASEVTNPQLQDQWNLWLDVQAWLFWRFKQAPENQLEEQRIDDYMRAKRYLGFLIAEDLLAQILRQGGCPRTLLHPVRVHYLSLLTIEDYLRFKAYLFYLTRVRGGWDRGMSSFEKSDYYAARGFLSEMLCTLVEFERSAGCRGCGSELSANFSSMLGSAISPETLECISKAKLIDMIRLNVRADSYETLRSLVHALYKWLLTGANDRAPAGIASILENYFGVMNMSELFVMCLAAYRTKGNPGDMLPKELRADAVDRKAEKVS